MTPLTHKMGCRPSMPVTIDNIIKLDGDSDGDGNDFGIFGFLTIGKSDRSDRSDRNKTGILRIITI